MTHWRTDPRALLAARLPIPNRWRRRIVGNPNVVSPIDRAEKDRPFHAVLKDRLYALVVAGLTKVVRRLIRPAMDAATAACVGQVRTRSPALRRLGCFGGPGAISSSLALA